MTWLHGIGWGWAGCVQQVVVMVVLWGAVATAVVLMGHFLTRQRNNLPALRDTSPIHINYVLTEGWAQRKPDVDQWHRRLM